MSLIDIIVGVKNEENTLKDVLIVYKINHL